VINYLLGGLGMDLLSGQNGIAIVKIWQSDLHESCSHLSQLSTRK
jgi:hypothetical protein